MPRSLSPFSLSRVTTWKVDAVCTIGAGKVGAVTSVILAKNNPEVFFTVVDRDEARIRAWTSSPDVNSPPVQEPGLQELLPQQNLQFSADVKGWTSVAKIIFVAVPTPADHGMSPSHDIFEPEHAGLDLTELDAVAKALTSESNAERSQIVVIRSTIPPGAAERISRLLKSTANPNCSFTVLSNPEILAQGTAVHDLLQPDCVVIGCDSSSTAQDAVLALRHLYSWVPDRCIQVMSHSSAAVYKLANNALLAQRVSTTNAIAAICENFNSTINLDKNRGNAQSLLDWRHNSGDGLYQGTEQMTQSGYFTPSKGITPVKFSDVSQALTSNTRLWGHQPEVYSRPSPGFGGPCLAKDVLALSTLASSLNLSHASNLFRQPLLLNKWQFARFMHQIILAFGGNGCDLSDVKFAILGYSYKENAGEEKNGVASAVAKELLLLGAGTVSVYDPHITRARIFASLSTENDGELLGDHLCVPTTRESTVAGAHALIIMNPENEYQSLSGADWRHASELMKAPKIVFDARNCLDAEVLRYYGLRVERMGEMAGVPECPKR